MPAEWEKHDAIWLSWPHDPITFPDRVQKVEKVFLNIIKTIHKSERVNLFVRNEDIEANAFKLLTFKDVDLSRISFFVYNYADVWFRDYGPIFLLNKNEKKIAMSHWIFNAWGGKYKDLIKDTEIPSFINKHLNLPCFKPGIILEGGSIDVNGNGTLLTTEVCLLNKNRNAHLGKNEIEKYLKEFLGVTNIIWLKDGIVGDDTDGHIDDIARFVNLSTVLCCYEENKEDANYKILKENYEILCESKDQDGNRLEVVKLPMPGFIGDKERRLPASYANFYIGNSAVLAPVFGKQNDKKALEIIQRQFPERSVVGINCSDLVYGLGTLHCISQQQPAL
ncbi:MAG: hypothetical protein A3C43_08020 [Candidatus Schekmanbacteria bacterium RIFCSPHIGHO2_02_FULL_38_11]|uniref:Agmatine deiminase n=1 Tax=Candidatus Schekmanbacteria bacterium RIFCSPLOWO2_12_FULL_38_15 TaxID=1817883 RepID=A0A1F7SL37_9BACT|nr:MAG: hypothetical protein A3H37_08290 [Candidatus Schekmanbacteria bacterium RIFCSPLOWO2_02_FULL_38_14]OGL48328.1 MAG: hypothetical protein A3C43_08020 [Candidatus Schekmanbacteria bacterium RIFCSPHIGHO2_02_FULL_38_11]OGL54502.1 MAG: hypothetical protein A3G31_10100 [Candidatus Schekmanbacteria bacterium RIFCSPLOWO2_12_FULL_38_15]